MSDEHSDVLKQVARLTEGSVDERGDALSALMHKEARVLDTVDRVINTTRSNIVDSKLFTHLTLTEIAGNAMRTLRAIMFDVTHLRRPYDLVTIFMADDRKIYVGLFIVAIAWMIFFASSAS